MQKFFGYAAVIVGFLLLAGIAGNNDYWEACHHAVDCVAGDPPSVFAQIAQGFIGILIMIFGCAVLSDV
jgi:hypothetical protein